MSPLTAPGGYEVRVRRLADDTIKLAKMREDWPHWILHRERGGFRAFRLRRDTDLWAETVTELEAAMRASLTQAGFPARHPGE